VRKKRKPNKAKSPDMIGGFADVLAAERPDIDWMLVVCGVAKCHTSVGVLKSGQRASLPRDEALARIAQGALQEAR
jgi:hypothetical protein